jgi:hypothetical protein
MKKHHQAQGAKLACLAAPSHLSHYGLIMVCDARNCSICMFSIAAGLLRFFLGVTHLVSEDQAWVNDKKSVLTLWEDV